MSFLNIKNKNIEAIMLNNLSIFLIIIVLVSCNNKQTSSNTSEIQVTKANIILVNNLPVALNETSGLCFTDGNLWTINDAGNTNSLYRLDTNTGEILQVISLNKKSNTDWEDLTADEENIYIGDFGNNEGNREDLHILIIKKSDIDFSLKKQKIKAETIKFKYPEQENYKRNVSTNFDCEAIIALESNLYLFTKRHDDLETSCYSIPKVKGKHKAKLISSFNTKGKITAAAYNQNTKELALGGYMNLKTEPFIWLFKNFKGDNFFNGLAKRIELENENNLLQFEGLDYKNSKSFFLSCESDLGPAKLYNLKL